jgi:hypothetical protein
MTRHRIVRTMWFVVAAALMVATTGCSGCLRTPDPVRTPLPKAVQDLGTIAQVYCEAFEETGKAPESFGDLNKYLTSFGNPDEMQISPNDGQPYVVIWGGDPTRGGAVNPKGLWHIVAHEKVGKDGMRAVADMRGLGAIVTEEEFAQLKFIGKRKSKGR